MKYTPDHLHCTAHFWGPVTPQGTGLLALQSVSAGTAAFRVAATGTVLDLDKSAQVVKKLKLVGTPNKVMKKTAFIQVRSRAGRKWDREGFVGGMDGGGW